MDQELSDSEEEILVYAEFEDSVNVGHYRSIHVLGVNEKNPVVQMDETFFTGNYENPLGTYMFFEEDSNAQITDPLLDKLPEKNLKYFCKTRKLLAMEHAYMTPKEGTDVPSQPSQEADEIEAVNFNSITEALEKFKTEVNWNAACKPESSSTTILKASNVPTSED